MTARITAVMSVTFFLIAGMAAAHEGATGIVRERMDLMTGLADAMKSIAAKVRSDESWKPESVAEAAERIRAHSRTMPSLFPAGDIPPVSAAKPEIWQQRDRFDGLFRELAERAAALEQAATSGDRAATMLAFRETGRTCSACHKEFRVPKKH